MKKLNIIIYILLLFSPLFISSSFANNEVKVNDNSIFISISDIQDNYLSGLPIDSNGLYIAYNFVSIANNPFNVESKIVKSKNINKNKAFTKFLNYSIPDETKRNDNYTITHIGTYKGIDLYQIRIYPAYISKKRFKLIDEQFISINFENEIKINHNYFDLDIDKYFQNIINHQHLSYFAYQVNLDKSIINNNKILNTFQDNQTVLYNPNLHYIEISTSDDGIGFIPVSEVLKIYDDLYVSTHEYKFLHLAKNGYEIPYFVNSKNGLINPNDTLFFESSRNSGDTTYYDHYNKYQKFYLFYDNSYNSKILTTQEHIATSNHISQVETKFHFEIDSLYCEGQFGDSKDENFLDPTTGSGEGWFESDFRPNLYQNYYKSPDTLKEYNKLLFPANNSEIEFKFAFYLTRINERLEYNNNIKTDINNLFSNTEKYKYIRNDYYRYNNSIVNSNNLLYGINNIKYTAIPLKEVYTGNGTDEDGAMGVDYLSISGKFLPIVIDDKITFKLGNIDTPSNLELYPFSSDKVLAIDPDNNLLFNYNAVKGYSISINSSNTLSKTEFYINNVQAYSDNKIGFHLLYLDEQNKPIAESFDQDLIEVFVSKVNNIKNQNYIAVAINKLNLSNTELNLLKSININTDNYNPNNALALIIDKNTKNSIGNISSKNNNEEKISKYIDFIPDNNGTKYKISLYLATGQYDHIIVSDYSKLNHVILENTSSTNLKDTANESNYLIISSKQLEKSALKYKEYRETTHKNIKTNIVFVEDIFKEFSFGKRNPQFIKNYISYAYRNWKNYKLQTILLLGDASVDPRKIVQKSKMNDIVPSFGIPVSDSWYTMMDGDNDYISDINISRIPAQINQDFDNYFEKLVEFEKKSNASWKNSVLFMVGGESLNQQYEFDVYFIKRLMEQMQKSNICFDYEKIKKNMDNKVSDSEGPKIIQALNKGKIFTYFVGHGSAEVLDMEGWMPNNLSNFGKNGIFYASSCSMGAFGLEVNYSRFEQLLFVPKGGFVFTIGNSATDRPAYSSIITEETFVSIFDKNERNFLKAFNYGKAQALQRYPDTRALLALKRFSLTGTTLGDPLINLPIDTIAELYLLPEEFQLSSTSGNYTITEDDENIIISFTVRNAGIKNFDTVKVNITDKYQNKIDTFKLVLNSICPKQEILNFIIPIKGKLGQHFLTITIDPDSSLVEYRRDNNILSRQFEVVQNSILALEPMPNWNSKTSYPHFRFINPITTSDSLSYEFKLIRENNLETVIFANNNNIEISGNVIDWKPNITLISGENYIIEGSFYSSKLGKSYPINIPFTASTDHLTESVEHKISLNQLKRINFENLQFNEDSKLLTLPNDSIKVDFMSIAGTDKLYPHRVYKGIYLNVNDNYYISEPILYGAYIAKFNNDFSKHTIKYFNTWGDYAEDDAIKDSTPIKFVQYLKDSVNIGDNIFIGTTGSAFRVFSLHKKLKTAGSWDTLKTILNNWGAQYANTIDTSTINKYEHAWDYSYVFFSHIGDGYNLTYDKVNLNGDTARIISKLPIKHQNANISFNVNHIEKLKNIKIKYNKANNLKLNHILLGKNTSNNQNEILKDFSNLNLHNSNSLDSFVLEYKDIDKYHDFTFQFEFYSAIGELNNFEISEIQLNYIPLDEINITQTNTLKNDLLKADPDSIFLEIRNLSLRKNIDSLKVNISVSDKSNIIDNYDTLYMGLTPNLTLKYSTNLITDNYSDTIIVNSKVNVVNKNDIYFFNNNVIQNQIFAKDTIKPTIELEVDEHLVSNNEFVGKYPQFKILIRDNSKKAINSDANIRTKINLKYVSADNMQVYEFKSYPKDTNLRATLIFKPDSLDYDENLVRIIAEDANQNKDTVLYRLNVSRQGYLKHISIFPNPAKVNSTIFFNFAAPSIDGYANIEIYDAIGRTIISQKSKLNIGNNIIPIKLTGNNNEKLPLGVYYYKISIINTEIIAEPMIDKFVIIE